MAPRHSKSTNSNLCTDVLSIFLAKNKNKQKTSKTKTPQNHSILKARKLKIVAGMIQCDIPAILLIKIFYFQWDLRVKTSVKWKGHRMGHRIRHSTSERDIG